jgi:hypothetical protein
LLINKWYFDLIEDDDADYDDSIKDDADILYCWIISGNGLFHGSMSMIKSDNAIQI